VAALGRRPKSHELSGATAQGEGGGTEVWLDIGKCLGVAVMLWWSCAVTFLSGRGNRPLCKGVRFSLNHKAVMN
jgi:hypothetical protein